MRIAILGTRGIPANYGGFETFAEELAWRLVQRGHDVDVYCRSHYVSPELKNYRGARLVVLPTVRSKHLDTVAHTLWSTVYALFQNYDSVLLCNAANSFACGFFALGRVPTVLNVDGIERLRKKWGTAGRFFYRVSEYLATRWASRLVSDAQVIRQYYLTQHATDSEFIPYGFAVPETLDEGVPGQFGVQPRDYYLYVSRLEPENNADLVLEAHRRSGTGRCLLMVGDAPYAAGYISSLKTKACDRVVFCGSVYGSRYHALQAHAYAYIQATEVGGTHPALVEAMGHGNLVVANDTPENREVLADTGLYYSRNDAGDLARRIQEIDDDNRLREVLGNQAKTRVMERYKWDDVVDRYEQVFRSLLNKNDAKGRRPL